ncbi:polysaccharide biosynthesis protein [Rhodanobacter sp. Root627]|uniref:oligosaccharide flippase family protein n=1 Tax=Rhodanobacter sp. Root627 TaxID=1736572 RepID=UPI0006FDB8F6|nr:oligosaccharide flippase family protein [Rhodanobacter sp. Root627]KRA33132.1 polysaccharide biosynthesis protein [Rhodanobacter sp. Root627]
MPAQKLSLRRSLVFSFAEKYTSFAVSLAAIVIVSRLLTPEEIGIFSVAVGVTTLANTLRTFGVSNYLVQVKDLTDNVIRTCFTINLLIAWSLALIIFASSWQIGAFFHSVGVGDVMRVQSLSFILVPFGITALALLRRDMAFGTLYKINVSSNVANSCMTIGLAFLGFSYMSMAWASVVAMLVMVLGCVVWGHERRVRGVGISGWRDILPFGAKMTVSDIALDLGQQSANIVIGRMLGMADAGFYSRGYGPVNMFREKVVAAVKAVAFPAFAAEHRETTMAPQLFLRALVYLTGISWPFFAFAALMAFPMIRIMFGTQWDAAVPLMRWLCGAAIVGTLIYQCNSFFVAIGRVNAATIVEIQYQLAGLLLAVAAAFISVEAVAASQVLVYVIATLLYYRKMRDFDVLALGKCARALMPSAAITVTTGIVPVIVLAWPSLLDEYLIPSFAVAVVGAGCGWIAGIVLVKHPLLVELRSIVARLQGLLPGFRKL